MPTAPAGLTRPRPRTQRLDHRDRPRGGDIGGLARAGLRVAALAIASFAILVSPARASVNLSVHWTAGGVAPGTAGMGQASDVAVSTAGDLAVVSGPAFGRGLGVTSYTPTGALRWPTTILPPANSYGSLFNEIVAAPGGDLVAVGQQERSITLARFAADGTTRWRVDSAGVVRSLGALVVDGEGNAYLPFNSVLHKYSPAGALVWERPTSSIDYGTALSPDGTLVAVTGASGGIWRTAAFDAVTGDLRWMVHAAEGTAATDVVVDATRVYVVGQGTIGIRGVLSVVAYDRATGMRLWRADSAPAGTDPAIGFHVALAPGGGVVVAGYGAGGGYWWNASIDAGGAIRWQA
jgi:PQQ-like domain